VVVEPLPGVCSKSLVSIPKEVVVGKELQAPSGAKTVSNPKGVGGSGTSCFIN